jgi:hypothetical protein
VFKPPLAIQLLVTLPGVGLTLDVVERVLRQGGVKPILELSALTHEHHPRPRQLALVTRRARRNPHPGQRPVPLQHVEPAGVEPIRLVDLPL